ISRAGTALADTSNWLLIKMNPIPAYSGPGSRSLCTGNAVELFMTSVPTAPGLNFNYTSTSVSTISGNRNALAQTFIWDTLVNNTAIPQDIMYSVVPIITQNGFSCSGVASQVQITVNPKPNSGFVISASSGNLLGLSNRTTYTFSDTTQGSVLRSWMFSDLFSSTQANINRVFSQGGLYAARVVNTNTYGCPDTSTVKQIYVVQSQGKVQEYRLGGTNIDRKFSSIFFPDSSYILAGYTESLPGGTITTASKGSADYWVNYMYPDGTKSWERRFGGSNYDELRSIIRTSDNGYLLGGISYSGISGDKSQNNRGGADYWIVKLNSLGNKQWDARFGGITDDILISVYQTADGGYLLAGYSDSGIGGDKSAAQIGDNDFWVVKTNSSGVKQWDYTYGGTGTEQLFVLEPTPDNGFILGGSSNSPVSLSKSEPAKSSFADYWMIKINASGIKVWDKTIGGQGEDILGSVKVLQDGSILLAGQSDSNIDGDKSVSSFGLGTPDLWLVKLDANRNKVWDNAYGGTSTDLFSSFNLSSDGGFLISGISNSAANTIKSQNSIGIFDYWTLKLDQRGKKIWDNTWGGTASDNLLHVNKLEPHAYLFSGYTESQQGNDFSTPLIGFQDAWMLKAYDQRTWVYSNEPNVCLGDSLRIGFGSRDSLGAGNTFTIQLSNAAGAFSNIPFTATRSIAKNTTDSIIWALPANIISSRKYRFRIFGTNPRDTMLMPEFTIYGIPKVGFTMNTNPQLFTNHIFSFNDTTFSNPKAKREWIFSDGSIDSVQTKAKTFATWGNYTVKLKSSFANCSDSVQRTVTVRAIPPTVSASGLSFTNITGNSIRVNFTKGNGERRLVIARLSAAVNSSPVNYTQYTARAVFGQGTLLGTNNFVVYKDTGTFVVITGLPSNTVLHVSVFEMNGDTNFCAFRTATPLIGNTSTLPVKWLHFNANRINENEVKLNWATATELNNQYFVVQRKVDTWTDLDTLIGAGTSQVKNVYQYIDQQAHADEIYYRIKQIDFDGRFDFSNEVFVSKEIKNAEIKLYPNPSKGYLHVEYPITYQSGEIKVFDITGQLLFEARLNETGKFESLMQMKKGIYLVQIHALGQKSVSTKWIVE
ncbi:MAG: T9SS type A sorting domain-containing protein, partial [Bacteroidia bacterium]